MIKRLPTTIHKYKLDRWPFAIMASTTTRFYKEYLISFFCVQAKANIGTTTEENKDFMSISVLL
jgi:hypothetical protein